MKTSNSRFGLWSALLLVGLGAASSWLIVSRRHQPKAVSTNVEAARGDDELAALRQQLHALQSEQSLTRAQVQGLSQQSRAAKPGAAPKEDSEPLSEDELRKRDYERSKHIADFVENALRLESADATWGPQRAEDIQKSFKEFKLEGFKFKDAECKSTLCRTTVSRAEGG